MQIILKTTKVNNDRIEIRMLGSKHYIINRLKYIVASRMVFLYISRQFHYLLCKNWKRTATPERNDGAPKKSILDGWWVDVRDKGDPTFVAGVARQ